MNDLPPPNPTKASLRKQALLWRAQLPMAEISLALCARLAAWPVFQRASQVLFYYPFRGEVDLRSLWHEFPQKAWYLPAISPAQDMIFRRVDADLALQPGRYGILEPPATASPWTGPGPATLLLIPGLLYDAQGFRLGYGKGYYDRFLSLPQMQSAACPKVGVAPTALIHPALAHDPWDAPVDFLATEEGVRPVGGLPSLPSQP
jgi:5-formyltetrahydrofolate cyclo-ligase